MKATAAACAALTLLLAPGAVFCEETQIWSGEIHFGTHVRQLADAGSFPSRDACNEWVAVAAGLGNVRILSAREHGDAVTYRGITKNQSQQNESHDDWRAFCRKIR